ncbi:MAG TPA: hypothetical protein VD902_12370 [Symbiobacteriaceae bacterium]|nr:hypothetical protein [Symbiobacteriaceae bacterium]
MTRVYIGLMTREGDRLGHLVRGVQMLRSYGSEVKVMSYSDVVDASDRADEPPALCCLLECSSTADLEGLRGIMHETQWALGDENKVLTAHVVQFGEMRMTDAPGPLLALRTGQREPGTKVALTWPEFAKACDWGQQATDSEHDPAGEWPSATGR